MATDSSVNSAEIHQLSDEIGKILTNTLTPNKDVRKAAEDALLKLETSNKLYGLATLYLTCREGLTHEIHVSSAIAFKNFIKRNWRFDPYDETSDQVDKIDPNQRELIKQHITKLMLKSPEYIQRQLSEAITIIGQSDFPEKWPWLIVELENSLKENINQNFNSVYGTLQTAHSIFRRYRYELPSNRLWKEIKLVITQFAPFFTERFKELVSAVKIPGQEPIKLVPVYQSLLLCTKIYHSLIIQDLPEFFEDRINEWLPLFLDLLTIQEKLTDSTVIEEMKSEICEIASLFVQRYSDAENFKDFTHKFAQNIWNLLVTTSQDLQNDTLVSNAIRYLVTVAERPESRSMFQDDAVLNLLCQKVIIPNLTFREMDEELFEDDPEEYVKRDIEGSDVETRRRAACDLVRALSKFLEVQLIQVFGQYIEEMLKSYELDRTSNWRHKDLAIFLYSSLAIKGSTRQSGTVSISQHVNVEKFLEEKIIGELISDSNTTGSQILKADALRYMTTFRNHISLGALATRLPLIVKHIASKNVVVRTYASITIEKFLTMRDRSQTKATAFKPEHLNPILGELLSLLMDAIDAPESSENEHIMKAIMRLASFPNLELINQLSPNMFPRLTAKLVRVAQNPSKPYFNHYLFETFALTIRNSCSQDKKIERTQYEEYLFNLLDIIVTRDVQEFTPYILQILNLFFQTYTTENISQRYIQLFQEILSPALWERPANIRPLTELMHTYIIKMGQHIIVNNKLIAILGIFQKLIASKATDHEGLALLQTMMIYLPAAEVDARIRDIFMLIFQRLTGSKTNKFVKNVLVCFSLYAYLRGADQLACAVNQLQDKIFGMVIEKLYIVDVKKVSGTSERRICVCGVIKILSQLPLIDNGAYNHLWPALLVVLMEIFELPPEVTNDEDDHFVDIGESLDFQAQYSKLNYASVKRDDPTKEVGDLKALLANSLANLSTKLPGFVPRVLQDNLDQGVVSCLMKYCQAANVTLS